MSAVDQATHKVTKAKVVRLTGGRYGIEFEFDDGYTDLRRLRVRKPPSFMLVPKSGKTFGWQYIRS
jgi:hypothetical protein